MVANDLTIYSRFAEEWWVPGAPRFRSLQNITPFRLELIDELVGDCSGKCVFDIGCGGGLISVPLLDRGAVVTGIDISKESIQVAKEATKGRGTFLVGDAREVPLPDASADIVLLMDVVDHIKDYSRAVSEAYRLVKPGGYVYLGTINRTWQSWIGAIVLGEGLRLIPPGTHDHSMFVTPQELEAVGRSAGLTFIKSQGERVLLAPTILRWAVTLARSKSCALAYSMLFKRHV